MVALNESYACSRCSVACELVPWPSEQSEGRAWYCPCCRSRTRTPAMIEADAERRAAEKGVTVDELWETQRPMLRDFTKEPLTEAEQEHIEAFVAERAKEWTPVCPHDTENPWLPTPAS